MTVLSALFLSDARFSTYFVESRCEQRNKRVRCMQASGGYQVMWLQVGLIFPFLPASFVSSLQQSI